MNSGPDISIVIATRNRWPLLSAHALPSALCQEDVEFEVIVVDDASTDETRERLGELDDLRVRIVRHETCRRLAAARNSGAATARGAWLAFLDDDDLWAPRKLRAQLGAAAIVGADWGYGKGVVVDSEKRLRPPRPDPVGRHEGVASGTRDSGDLARRAAQCADVLENLRAEHEIERRIGNLEALDWADVAHVRARCDVRAHVLFRDLCDERVVRHVAADVEGAGWCSKSGDSRRRRSAAAARGAVATSAPTEEVPVGARRR